MSDGLPAHLIDAIRVMSMTEIVRLQNFLSQELSRRFGKSLALAFSDIVGSTPYFARFGDEAGGRLQQCHVDILHRLVPESGGRIVDQAGDGVFMAFLTVDAAATALIALQNAIARENASRHRDHQLHVRVGIHWGSVLTDGVLCTGDSVNLCSRVTGTGSGGEIRLTREAFQELSDTRLRLACRPLSLTALKGIARPVEILALDWIDRSRFPERVRVVETGEEIALPQQDTICFGRVKKNEGVEANDIVLTLPDEAKTRMISRWHFELRRHPEGFMLRPVSDSPTELDGRPVPKWGSVLIRPGSTVGVARVMTLVFLSEPKTGNPSQATLLCGEDVGSSKH